METLDPADPTVSPYGETPLDNVVPMPEQDPDIQEQERALVKQWQSRIVAAKKKWEPDFKRMRRNMEFAYGVQWENQVDLLADRYVNNIVQNIVKQKVASLYAKNPTAVAERRPRLDFKIWDEDPASLHQMLGKAMMMAQAGVPLDIETKAFLLDVQHGQFWRSMVDKVSKTLEILHAHAIDSQKPEFKTQLKAAVRRAVICGVAFGRPIFCSQDQTYGPNTTDAGGTPANLQGRAQALLSRLAKDDATTQGAEVGTLRSLATSIATMLPTLPEHLEFDFPPANSVIVDERCRSLVDFVGARWLAQEFVLPVDEVNALFGTDVRIGGSEANDNVNVLNQLPKPIAEKDAAGRQLVRLWEVFDYETKTKFFMVDGWKDFITQPAPPDEQLSGFWHHFAITFNEVEADPCDDQNRTSIYPPSDVDLVRSAQQEWNRTRDALRDHRNANAPKYLVRKGMLTPADKEKLRTAEPNSVIELEGVPPDQPLEKFIIFQQFAPITDGQYDTSPLEQDLMLGGGMQQANIGPAQPNVTATVGTIAEQSRLNVSSSNVDDLDRFLSCLAQAAGEIMLQRYSPETVERIAGPGGVFPTDPAMRADFLAEIFLKIEAGSSGRPNKAMEIANWRDIAPLLIQSGANPVGMVMETAKRLDDTLDSSKFFPLMPMALPQGQGEEGAAPSGSSGSSEPETPPPPSPAMASANGSDGFAPPEPSAGP